MHFALVDSTLEYFGCLFFHCFLTQGGRGQSKSTKVIYAPREEVQLNKAENRWVRPSERQKELSEEDKETIELFRKFQVRVSSRRCTCNEVDPFQEIQDKFQR